MTFVNNPRTRSIYIGSPTGSLEVVGLEMRVYTTLAARIVVCIDAELRTGERAEFVAMIGELDSVARIGELVAFLQTATGLDAELRTGAGLDEPLRIGESLDAQLVVGGVDQAARVTDLDMEGRVGGLDEPAKIVELDMVARTGSGLEAVLRVCE